MDDLSFVSSKADERYKEYLKRFEPETPNDEQMLYQLAWLEAQMEVLRNRVANATLDASAPHTKIKALNDTLAKMSFDHRKIQDELGISFAKRSSEDDAAKELPRIIHGAARYLSDHAIFLYCPHCRVEEAQVKIRLGHILFHFRQDVPWGWWCECPRCGKRIELDWKSWKAQHPEVIIPADGYIPDFAVED